MKFIKVVSLIPVFLSGCNDSKVMPAKPVTDDSLLPTTSISVDTLEIEAVEETKIIKLFANGENQDTRNLVKRSLGENSLELPEEYVGNHKAVHLFQEYDSEISRYVFNFEIHKEFDKDRSTIDTTRQRVEIKSDRSEINAFYSDEVHYSFLMRISDLSNSYQFTHLMQLKPSSDGITDKHPLITITVSGDLFKIRHYDYNTEQYTVLSEVPLDVVNNKWLNINLNILYSHEGNINLNIIKNESGDEILSIKNKALNLWFDNSNSSYSTKFKSGIYRDIKDVVKFGDDNVKFADYSFLKITGN